MELTDLRHFINVAFANSFSRGAKQSHVTTPAVSKSIQKLEEEFQTRLFERTTRSVSLTSSGTQLLKYAERIFSDLDSFRAELEGREEKISGELRIAANEVLSIDLLPTALAELLRQNPQMQVSTYEMVPELMTAALREGRVDVGLTIGGRDTTGITLTELGRSDGVLVCGKNHPLYGKRRITAREVREHVCIAPKFLGLEHLPSIDQFPEQAWPRKTFLTIELLQMGIRLAEEGAGLGYFPRVSVRQQLNEGRLWSFAGLPEREPFVLRALTREGVQWRPAVRALLEEVSRNIHVAQKRRRS